MPDYTFTGYNSKLEMRAKELRKNMTKQERHLWYDFLRTYPVKFYRQRVIDCYIVDFYCSKAKLVIEIDGSQHYTEDGMAYDKIRSEILECYGLHILRFANSDVDRNFSGVCQCIDETLKHYLEVNDNGNIDC